MHSSNGFFNAFHYQHAASNSAPQPERAAARDAPPRAAIFAC
jgi:hypothetical protein